MTTFKGITLYKKQGKITLPRSVGRAKQKEGVGLVAGLICPNEGMELAPCRAAMQHQQVVKASSGHNPPPFLISDVKN